MSTRTPIFPRSSLSNWASRPVFPVVSKPDNSGSFSSSSAVTVPVYPIN